MLAHRLPLGGSGLPDRLIETIESNETGFIAAVLGLFALVCAALLALPAATFLTHAPHDSLIFVDAAYRLAHGQVPHLDFHTSVGALSALLPYLGLVIGGSFGAAMPTALVVALAALAPMIVYVLATRFRWYLALPVGALLILLIAAPLITGDVPSRITMAMWYNRFCWAVLSALFLMWMTPRPARATAWPVEGIIAGLLVLILVYTKITYGLVSLAYLGFWFAVRQDSRRTVAVAAGVCIAVAVGLEVVWRLNSAYLADIALALKAGPALRGGLLQPIKTALKSSQEVVLVCLAIAQLAAVGGLKARDLLYTAFVLLAGLAIINQNSEDASIACLIAALAVAAERVVRSDWPNGIGKPWVARLAALSLIVAFVAEPLVYRSVALYRHYSEAHAHDEDPRLPASLAGFHARDVKGYTVVEAGTGVLEAITAQPLDASTAFSLLRDRTMISTPNLLGTAEYFFTLGQGVKALSGLAYAGKDIFAFDIVNPFPFILGTPPSEGALFCYHLDRQYSRDYYLPVDTVLGQVAFALVPKFPMEYKDRDALMELYGGYLRRHFAVVADTPYWTVWERGAQRPARSGDGAAMEPARADDDDAGMAERLAVAW